MTSPGPPGPPGPSGPTRATAQARPWQRTAWIAAAVLSALLIVAPATWQAWSYSTSRSGVAVGGSDGRPVTALEIVGGGANVTVTPRADQEVGYRAELSWSLRAPTIEESWLGDTLRLTPRCPGVGSWLTSGVGCSVQLGVTVPVGIPVKVTAGSGQVDISGLGGTVDADVGSGRINLTALRGALRAKVGSGSLVATGLTSTEADIRVDSGRAAAVFLTPPDHVTARAGSGRVAVTVPAATRFRVTCEATGGRCQVPPALHDPSSPRTLDLRTAVGRAAATYPER
ncbi:hypothetical protein ACFWBN_23460 [Streptomyces sp. NPDC059989]|uniref:hypothetical protein n=1 Tax=Streptomyces sp. NPDC059989 TaxID=3347026 RepID=UPI0036B3C392